jgi:ATP-dependent exoDNAse (exonuclease V) beta subunit
MSAHIRFISAGAGSGKTYRVTEELQAMLSDGSVQPSGVMATTFTRMAATELRERVRQKLMANGNAKQAAQMGQAMIGTVNGVCGSLLARFAFEAGLSPDQKVLEEEQANRMFGAALESLLDDQPERIPKLNALARRFGLIDDAYQPNWRGEVMTAASAARSNNMSPEQIRSQEKASTDELLALFMPPYSTDADLNQELLTAVTHALDNVDQEHDTTKGTENYLVKLRDAQAALRQNRLAWSEWVSLSKAKPTKKSEHLAEPIQIIAGDFEKHPLLHVDLRELCAEVFELAADSIEAYQALKAQQGMLDFVDQEQRLYELLDHPHVKSTLGEELQVLFVDEFQDTSPIQLALFMKLAALADQVVWVGDIKQAIYGFRGSDPALMQAVLQGVTDGGGRTDVLQYSWRSRPPLVNYINQVFVPTFAASIPAEQVTLEPKRREESGAAAVACWHLAGSTLGKRARDLAFGIQELVDSKYPITDKESGSQRAVDYGDIAVLCRTNARLIGIADACAQAGIPVAFKRSKLLQTPEGALAMACLRRLADPRDSLASAEIRTLIDSESPEDWLAERLEFLEGDEKAWLWGESGDSGSPALRALGEARKELPLLTPSEALELALAKGRTREAAIAWGPTANHTRHRLRNLDLLLEYAAKYEDQCDMLNLAATVPGLILWLHDLAKNGEDWQARAADGRAVTLVSHHGSKGLEWPVVIAVDLDADIRPRIWGLTVLQREGGFVMTDPLAGRRLRYWPWPFGRQAKGIAVADRVAESELGITARASAVEETRRLLYVSMTRARDHLIVPLPGKKPTGEWLESLDVDWLMPSGEQLTLPDGTAIPTDFKEIEAPDGWSREASDYEARWVVPGEVARGLLNLHVSPSSAEPAEGAVAGDVIDLGDRMQLDGVKDVTALGQAIHGIIAAEINSPDDEKGHRAARVLREWGFEESVDPLAAVQAAQRFIDWAKTTFDPVAWHVEHPITQVLESGQVVEGFIDLLLETKDGWVIVDHKATPRPRNEWKEIAEGYSGQLAMYQAAVEEASGKPVISMWIHMPVGGGVMPLGNL